MMKEYNLNDKNLLYLLITKLKDLYIWQLNQCIAYKKSVCLLLSMLDLKNDFKLLSTESKLVLSFILIN